MRVSVQSMRSDLVDWFEQAACKGQYGVMFPERENVWLMVKKVMAAKQICAGCPVKAECLEYALNNPHASKIGIWGGTTEKERRALRRRRRELTPL